MKITIPADHSMVSVLGSGDELLRVMEREFAGDIHVRGNEITVTGTPAETALLAAFFDEVIRMLSKGGELSQDAIERTAAMLRSDRGISPADVLTVGILSSRGRTIRPKTLNQKRYADAIDTHTIVFGIGPAGTGKTYLAMAKAVKALQAKEVNRIILTRPAVEAGERLGFLPGTLYEKIDPYLRPLYDALHDMVDPDSIPRLMAAGTIEIAPLAYMRGRAQPVTERVLTVSGWRPIGELTVGDLVIGSSGEPTPVIGVYPQGEKDIYRITTQDGGSTRASADHLWTVAASAAWSVMTTADMLADLRPGRYRLPVHTGPIRLAPGVDATHGCDNQPPITGWLSQPAGGVQVAARVEATPARVGVLPARFVDSIEPAGTAECVCIAVAAADSLYTTEDFLLTHNTLNDSFIILDEAQNTSAEQMKMFLTRLGFGSRVVVTGDVTQVDLPSGQVSGLRVVQDILEGIEDIHFARLTSHDVVRHRLVGKIVDAYERYDAVNPRTGEPRAKGTGRRK